MYLHNILNKDSDELTYKVYMAQRDNPTKGDFVNLVKADLEDIGVNYDEEYFKCHTKDQIKQHIKKNILKVAFKDLKLIQAKHSKVMNIQYNKFYIQPYMTSPLFTNDMVKLLFNLRSFMTRGLKNNFPSLFRGNLKCKLNCPDLDAIDCQEHLLSCQSLTTRLSSEQQDSLKGLKYSNIFGSTEEQIQIVRIFASLLEIREELLESLPVGPNIGPNIAVAPM